MTTPHLRRLLVALLAGLLLVPVLQATAADAGGSGVLTMTGVVRGKDGRGVADALIQFETTSGTSDATGHYKVTGVPAGAQTFALTAPCFRQTTVTLTFTGNRTKDLTLDRDRDAFGHVCRDRSAFIIGTTTVQPLTGDDASLAIPLPFAFPFYGTAK